MIDWHKYLRQLCRDEFPDLWLAYRFRRYTRWKNRQAQRTRSRQMQTLIDARRRDKRQLTTEIERMEHGAIYYVPTPEPIFTPSQTMLNGDKLWQQWANEGLRNAPKDKPLSASMKQLELLANARCYQAPVSPEDFRKTMIRMRPDEGLNNQNQTRRRAK